MILQQSDNKSEYIYECLEKLELVMDKSKFKGHLAAFTAYAIFGINIVSTKDISNCGLIQPMVLFTFRAMGATSLYWLISLFLPLHEVPLP